MLAHQTGHPIALAILQGQESLAAPFVEAFPGSSLLTVDPGSIHAPQPAVWPATGLIEFLATGNHQAPFEVLQRWAQDTAFRSSQETSAQTVHLALARADVPLPWLLATLELARAAHTRFLLTLPDLHAGATCYTPTGFRDLQRHLGLHR
ncbi:hypothetical protein ASF71_22045 [Deinococcus sp. Leaf326]|nr:hypothetical protein ASF71_22045 [Deinococcus sp. Leaf326]